MKVERRRLGYRGRVQGVGFRMTARRLASAYPISGYVKNLDDGGVELLVEGEPDVLATYLSALYREFGDRIHEVHEEIEPPDQETFAGFTIRY